MKLLIIAVLLYPGISLGMRDSLYNHFTAGLDELVKASLESNLSLKPADLEKKVLESRIDQVNKQPSPMLEFMVDFLPVTFSHSGEYGLFYTQPLQLFGKTGANEELALKNIQRAAIMRREIEYELIKSVKENYFMLSVNEKLIEFNAEFQEILDGVTKSLQIKYSVGKGNQYEILKSNNESQNLILEEIELRNISKLLINNLRNLSGLNLSDSFRTRNMEILISIEPPVNDTARLSSQLRENNPELQYLKQLKTESALQRNIAELEGKPEISFRTGYKYVPDAGESFLQFAIGVGLPFMPWNKRRIDAMVNEMLIEEKKAGAEIASAEWNLKNELRNQLLNLNSSLEKIRFYSEVLVPQAERTFKASMIAYETASADFMNVLDSYRALRENRQKHIMEQTAYLIQIAELEKLIGSQILTIN
jgi:outer membrane protein TolC